jgi:hypothetical protein
MGGRQGGRENKEIIKATLREEEAIGEDGAKNADAETGEGEGGKEKDENSGLTIGDLGSAKDVIEKVENKDKTIETGAGSETETETETDIIGEYQEVVGQFKNEFGGAFRDIPKDLQDDLGDAHKELQDIERKIEGLKTEKAKENAREKAEQILEELRAKMQEIEDSKNKEKKQGTGAEGDEDKNEVAKAERAETKEEWTEREKSAFEERMAEEDQSISKAYGSAIYKEFFDEKSFGLTNDVIKESQGVLEEQMKDVLVEDARNWLKDRGGDYPALEGQDIDELNESRIMDLVKNEKGFMDQLDKENEEWQKIRNLRDSIQKDSPPDVKLALFKRLSEGELKGKLWEKLTGENLDEKAQEEAGIGEKEVYINDASRLTDQKDLIEFFVKNELLGTSFEFSYAEWEKSLKGFDKKQREIVVNRMRQKEKEQEEKMRTIKENIQKVYPKKMMTGEDKKILALMNGGYDIGNIKLKGFFSKKVELQKIDGTKETKEYREFLKFVDGKVEEYNTDLEKKAKENLSKEWTEKIDAEKFEVVDAVVDAEAEKSKEDTIESCYQKIAQNRAAKFLEMSINKDPKRKAKIEREFGKGKREDIKDYISDAIEMGETIDEGSGYDENGDELKDILEKFHIDPGKLTKEQKQKFEEDCKKKYGLIQWIFDILFGKIKGVVKGIIKESIKGNKATTKK